MQRLYLFVMSVLLTFLIPLTVQADEGVLIKNVTVISPEREAPLSSASVYLKDGKIVRIAKQSDPDIEGVMTVDGTGKYLIPGLMDSHLHTTVVPGIGFLSSRKAKQQPALVAAFRQQLPRSLLYYGVTQFIDPAATPDVMQDFRAQPQVPDSFYCGAAPIYSGYPLLLMPESNRVRTAPYFIYEASKGKKPPKGIDPSQHTPEKVVERMKSEGAFCLKLFFEDGWGPQNHWPLLSESVAQTAIDTAQSLGMKVLAHANAFDMQQRALSQGVDVLAHGLWNWGLSRQATVLTPALKQHLDRVIERQTGFQSTFRVMDGTAAMFNPTMLDDPALTSVVPPALLAWYRTKAGQWFKQSLVEEEGLSDVPVEKRQTLFKPVIQRGEEVVKYLAGKSFPLLLGSDFPANPGYGNQPGLSTYQEMAHMAKVGLPLKALLASATINNARFFGLDAQYGSVEVGKVANLLLLDANPLQDVQAYRQINKVILRGEVIDRETLAAK